MKKKTIYYEMIERREPFDMFKIELKFKSKMFRDYKKFKKELIARSIMADNTSMWTTEFRCYKNGKLYLRVDRLMNRIEEEK